MGVEIVLVLFGVEVAMHPAHEQVQHGLLQVPHREVLVEPVMADEDAAALLVANVRRAVAVHARNHPQLVRRSEEHTSELQSLMRISYAVLYLKKKKTVT